MYLNVTCMSWFGSRGGLKFTKSSERPKVRLENRKSADLENRLNLKSGDEEVKGNTEEEGNSFFFQEPLHQKCADKSCMTQSVYFHPAGPVRGILKTVSSSSKPPVPSRSRVNAVLGVRLDQNPIGNLLFLNEQVRSRDSGNSSLDSSGSVFSCSTRWSPVLYLLQFTFLESRNSAP